MKTTKRPYFIVISRRFFRSQKYFLLSSSPPTATMASWWRHLNKLQVEFEDGSLKVLSGQAATFKGASHDKSSLSCLHTARSRWATRALQGGLDPNEISGVGTNFGLLVHVLAGHNMRRALGTSIILSWILRQNKNPGRLVRSRHPFRKFIFLWFAVPIWPDR
jgi:hypothetical protein